MACHIEATTDDVDITMTLNHVRLLNGFVKIVNWRTVSGRDTGLERRHAVIHYRSDSFAPAIEDEGRPLECIAHVRHSSSQMTTHVLLSVRHAPEGNCSAPQPLSDDSVRIRCTARSNPHYEEAYWSWINADGRQVRIPANETNVARSTSSCQACSNVNTPTFELITSHDEFASSSSYFLLIRNAAGRSSFIVPASAVATGSSAAVQPGDSSGAVAAHSTAVETHASTHRTTALRAGGYTWRPQTGSEHQQQPEQPSLPRIQTTIGLQQAGQSHSVASPGHRTSAAASSSSSAAVVLHLLTCAWIVQQSCLLRLQPQPSSM